MAALGPFERGPRLAVAVSGGADSLALVPARRALGARAGRRDRGPDRRPRPAPEVRRARRARTAALARGSGDPCSHPALAGRQARHRDPGRGAGRALRAARRLVPGGGRAPPDDSAITVTTRPRPWRCAPRAAAARMASPAWPRSASSPGLRLLRPLLAVPKAALVALLVARGSRGSTIRAIARPASPAPRLRAGRRSTRRTRRPGGRIRRQRRGALDGAVAAWLARHARIDAAGFVLLAHPALAAAPAAIARRAVQQALLAVGGKPYAPRQARLERSAGGVAQRAPRRAGGRSRGCRILRRGERLLICREPGAIARGDSALERGSWQLWDRRFAVRVGGEVADLRVRGARRRRLASARPRCPLRRAICRRRCAPSLPALWRGDRLLAVPQLGAPSPATPRQAAIEARYRPPRPLAGAPFAAGTRRIRHPDAAAPAEETFASRMRIAYVNVIGSMARGRPPRSGLLAALATRLHRGEAAG